MARPTFILAVDQTVWHVAAADASGVQTRAVEMADGILAATEPLKQALADVGHAGEPLTVLLPSRWCLAAAIDTAALPRRSRREAMAYALEEKLPVPAEECVAGFIESPGRALGVACALNQLVPLMTALETLGLRARSLTPAALVALQSASPASGLALVNGADLFEIEAGRPVAWRIIDGGEASLRRETALYISRKGEVTPEALAACEVHRFDADPLAAAARVRPWIDLLPALQLQRSPASAGAGVRYVMAALMLFGLVVPSALLWRAHRYDVAADQSRQQQRAVYQARFSAAAPQAGVLAVFQSELRAAQAAGANPLANYDSALHVMHDALRAVPDETHLRIRRLHVTTDRLELQAEAPGKDDAYAATKALSDIRGFTADLTQIEDAGRGKECRFTIVAKPSSAAAARGAAR